MALTQLAPPYPIFTDLNGMPLDNGYIYFGLANQNPETYPIQIYYDRELTQPAVQPVRTSNGYIMRNGSPALIYAASKFSVTVRNSQNSLVITSPESYGFSYEADIVDPAADSDIMFRRKLAYALPWTNTTLRSMATAVGASAMYPQGFAFDPVEDIAYVMYGPTGGTITNYDIAVVAYDVSTPSSPVTLSTFKLATGSSREYLIPFFIGTAKYLLANGSLNPMRFNISTLPADGAVVVAEHVYSNVRSYNHAAYDGRSFMFSTGLGDSGTGTASKRQVHVWNADLTVREAEYGLPSSLSSTYSGSLLSETLKSQSFCWHKGKIVFGIGSLSSTDETNLERDSTNQGIATYDPVGNAAEAFVVSARFGRSVFAQCFGVADDSFTILENEGVATNDGKLFALWTTVGDFGSDAALTSGIYITEEGSAHSEATDFSAYSSLPRGSGFDAKDASYYGWVPDQDGELKHPLTGVTLSTIPEMTAAMVDCGMTSFMAYTTGLTVPIVDPDGVNVPSGMFIRGSHAKNFGGEVLIIGNQQERRWWFSGASFFKTKVDRNSSGYLVLDGQDTWITSGTGSPEGAISGDIGCMWLQSDGGGKVYVKTTATGNSGWVALINGDATGGNVAISGNLTVDTNTLHVDSANNRVGMGTITPSATLDVVGDAEINGNLDVIGTTPSIDIVETDVASADTTRLVLATNSFRIQTANSGAFISEDYALDRNATGATSHRWLLQNINKMKLDSTGLGIGTFAPSAALDVVGNAKVSGTMSVGNIKATNGTTATYRHGVPTRIATSGSGTYTVPAGAVALLVHAVGAGGGGGGATSSSSIARSGGGGGGGSEIVDLIDGTLAASYSYAVGAGGAGSVDGDTDGSVGENTTFGTLIAYGGGAGKRSGTFTSDQIIGGTSSVTSLPTGSTNLVWRKQGDLGLSSFKISAVYRQSGAGGGSSVGTGATPVLSGLSSSAATGNAGFGSGSGGSGGNSSTTTGASGGAGSAGHLIITPLY